MFVVSPSSKSPGFHVLDGPQRFWSQVEDALLGANKQVVLSMGKDTWDEKRMRQWERTLQSTQKHVSFSVLLPEPVLAPEFVHPLFVGFLNLASKRQTSGQSSVRFTHVPSGGQLLSHVPLYNLVTKIPGMRQHKTFLDWMGQRRCVHYNQSFLLVDDRCLFLWDFSSVSSASLALVWSVMVENPPSELTAFCREHAKYPGEIEPRSSSLKSSLCKWVGPFESMSILQSTQQFILDSKSSLVVLTRHLENEVICKSLAKRLVEAHRTQDTKFRCLVLTNHVFPNTRLATWIPDPQMRPLETYSVSRIHKAMQTLIAHVRSSPFVKSVDSLRSILFVGHSHERYLRSSLMVRDESECLFGINLHSRTFRNDSGACPALGLQFPVTADQTIQILQPFFPDTLVLTSVSHAFDMAYKTADEQDAEPGVLRRYRVPDTTSLSGVDRLVSNLLDATSDHLLGELTLL